MSRSLKNPSDKKGLRPGSLVHVGDVHDPVTRITVMNYSKDRFEEHAPAELGQVLAYKGTNTVTWVMVEGLADPGVIESIGEAFNIHPLVLEDILNTHQRPKLEEHDDYIYIVVKSLVPGEESFSVDHEQISMVLLKGFVFTFEEKADDLLLPVQSRLRNSRGRFRALGADFLVYSVLDTIIDQNFDLLDKLEETLIALEDEIFSDPNRNVLNRIQAIKRDIIHMRRYLSPTRDLVGGLLRSESDLIDQSTRIYLRDVHDHILRITESLETFRDILSSLLEIYLSSISSRMNEVMKVLTVFASIFIPLTFLTGIYGMNFEFMPELALPWAYPAVWGAFVAITLGLLVYFRKKNWW